eukprot:scaffold27676_cov126-Isochrysis_galbana.AAC.2
MVCLIRLTPPAPPPPPPPSVCHALMWGDTTLESVRRPPDQVSPTGQRSPRRAAESSGRAPRVCPDQSSRRLTGDQGREESGEGLRRVTGREGAPASNSGTVRIPPAQWGARRGWEQVARGCSRP